MDEAFPGLARSNLLFLLPLVFLTATVLFWQWSVESERERIRVLTTAETARIGAAIVDRLESHAEASARAAEPWLLRDPRDQTEWDYDLFGRRWMTTELETMEWIDADLTARWRPSDTRPLVSSIAPREHLDRAVAEHRVVLAGPFFLAAGDAVLLAIVPISRGSEPPQWVVSVYRLQRMFGTVLQGSRATFATAVMAGDQEIFASHPEADATRQRWEHDVEIGYDALSLRLRVWPTAAGLELFRTHVPRLALLGGVLATSLIALGIRLAQVSSRRAGEARMNAFLQAEIRARKRAEKTLESKVRELSRSNREFERFAYAISHDLRDPLNAIALNLQMVLDASEALGEQDRRRLGQGATAVSRLDTMIGRLLDYARAGGGDDDLELVNATAVLTDATDNLEALIAENGAKVMHGRLPKLIARRSQLTRLFQNLIANAIKYRDERSPEIRVEAAASDEEWIFSVADNAAGMDEEQIEHAFELFWRHRSSAAPGSGIGLAVCKRIVEQHGGRVWIESTPGEGTTFFFALPADPDAVAAH
jgi:signal transduction histidine kinase